MTRPTAAAMPSILRRAFPWLVFLLALTGMAQMPIMKRYSISDLPGLGWLADFFTTHLVHYALGALFLFLLSWALGATLRSGVLPRLTVSGMLRAGLIAVVAVTGILRVIKNDPGVTLDPYFVLAIDWVHMIAAFLWGLAAIAFRLAGRGAYTHRSQRGG